MRVCLNDAFCIVSLLFDSKHSCLFDPELVFELKRQLLTARCLEPVCWAFRSTLSLRTGRLLRASWFRFKVSMMSAAAPRLSPS